MSRRYPVKNKSETRQGGQNAIPNAGVSVVSFWSLPQFEVSQIPPPNHIMRRQFMAVNPPSSTEDISYCHNDADWDRQHKEAREAKRDWTEGDVMLRRRRLQWMEALKGDEMKVDAVMGRRK